MHIIHCKYTACNVCSLWVKLCSINTLWHGGYITQVQVRLSLRWVSRHAGCFSCLLVLAISFWTSIMSLDRTVLPTCICPLQAPAAPLSLSVTHWNKSKLIQTQSSICFHSNLLKSYWFLCFFFVSNVIDGQTFLECRGIWGAGMAAAAAMVVVVK